MKIKHLCVLVSLIAILLSVNINALATELVLAPSAVSGNTVVAPSDPSIRATGADGWYSENKNVYWAGHNVSQSAGSSLSVNIIKKNGLDAFQTRVFNAETGKYSGVAYRVSHAHIDGQPNYTQELETAGVHEFGFEVTYFDSAEMAGNWLLCYMTWSKAENNVHKSFGHYGLPIVRYMGTNTWKRVRWTYDYGSDLTKWNFYSDGSEREDFKFYSVRGIVGSSEIHKDDVTVGPTYIHDFTMLPIDEFNEYCAKTSDSYLTADKGGVISYELESSISGYSTSEGTVGESDGRYGANIFAGTEVTFSSPATSLAGEKGAIVVDCYAPEKTKITVTDGDGNIRRVEHPGSSWQKLTFLRDEIITGEYTLKASGNISVASIHYEATERTIPPYDEEEVEKPDDDEEIPVINADVVTYLEPAVTTDGSESTITYRLTSAPADKKVLVVATYINPETEKILAINSAEYIDVSQIEDRKITVTLPDMTSDGGVLRCYVWESLTDVAPLGNYAPAAPDALTSEILGTNAYLSWNTPKDDFDSSDDLTYGIYDSGMLIMDGININSAELNNLILGEEYNFSVTATDSMGAESKLGKEVKGAVKQYNTIIATEESIGTSRPQESEDKTLMFVGAVDKPNYYNTYKASVVSGLTAYESIERVDDSGVVRPGVWSRIPFRINPNYANTLKSSNVDKLGFEVVYFDSAELKGYHMNAYISWGRNTDSIRVDAYTSAGYIPFTGSDSWKVYRGTVDLAGGWFAPNESNITRGNPHFEFYTVKGTTGSDRDVTPGPAVVHSLTVLPIDDFEEYSNASGASLNIKEGAVVSCNISSELEGLYEGNGVTKHDGRFGADIKADKNVGFVVDDSSLIGSQGSVVIYCYAEEETNIKIGNVTKTHSGKGWQKIRFEQMPIVKTYAITADKDISVNTVRVIAD